MDLRVVMINQKRNNKFKSTKNIILSIPQLRINRVHLNKNIIKKNRKNQILVLNVEKERKKEGKNSMNKNNKKNKKLKKMKKIRD